MSEIRAWAYTLCMASVLLGVLRGILPVKSTSAVIKLVFGLYILLLLLTPAQTYVQRGFSFVFDLPKTQDVTIDLTDAVVQQTQKLLQDALTEAFLAAGYPLSEAKVSGKVQDGSFSVEQVMLYSENTIDTNTAQQLLQQTLGCVPTYQIILTGGKKNG